MKERELLSQIIKQQLERAQQRMKLQADKNWSERSFAPGDMVYMKLQQYVQASVATRSNKKLSMDLSKYWRRLVKLHINWSCHKAARFIWSFMCPSGNSTFQEMFR